MIYFYVIHLFLCLVSRCRAVFVLGLCGFIFGVYHKPYGTYADSFLHWELVC